jgi:hypothetical protein
MSRNNHYAKLILYRGLVEGYTPGADPKTLEGEREIFQFTCRQLRSPENLRMDGYAMVPSEEEAARIISHTQSRLPAEVLSTIKILGIQDERVHFQRQLAFIGWDESRRKELESLLYSSGATFNLEQHGDVIPITFHSTK